MNTKIYLSSPHMGGTEQLYVQEAFDTNWIAPLGPNVSNFEIALENYIGGNSHVAALSSGTAAIHLALILAGVTSGDEVLCQSFTFSASANPIIYQGATPVFIDSESETWNMCPKQLKIAIEDRISKGKKPKAIIVVHLYGMPAKIDAIKKVAAEYEILLIEDSAEALGSTYKDQPCGTFGDFGVLSFNGNKIITTSGGGALVTKDANLKERAIYLATQARDTAPHYQHSTIGYNYRLSNICAGIGRGQMEVLDSHIELRQKMNAWYHSIFRNTNGIYVFKEQNDTIVSNHWLSCIVINPEITGFSATDIRLALEQDNIECRPLWKPMHLQPVFKEAPYYGVRVAEELFENGLCLPSGSNLTDIERERIKLALQPFV